MLLAFTSGLYLLSFYPSFLPRLFYSFASPFLSNFSFVPILSILLCQRLQDRLAGRVLLGASSRVDVVTVNTVVATDGNNGRTICSLWAWGKTEVVAQKKQKPTSNLLLVATREEECSGRYRFTKTRSVDFVSGVASVVWSRFTQSLSSCH